MGPALVGSSPAAVVGPPRKVTSSPRGGFPWTSSRTTTSSASFGRRAFVWAAASLSMMVVIAVLRSASRLSPSSTPNNEERAKDLGAGWGADGLDDSLVRDTGVEEPTQAESAAMDRASSAEPLRDSAEDAKVRTWFESGAWRQPGKKYFVYQSSGGLSNQRIMMEMALLLGRALNRTVVVPQTGPHTSMWWNFNRIPPTDMLPADQLLDAERMRSISDVLFLRVVSLKRLIEKNENQNGQTWHRIERDKLAERRANPWSMDYVVSTFRDDPADVLLFAKGTMWENFDFSPALVDEARRAVRAHARLREAARRVANALFPAGFNSLHIRFKDEDGTNLREGFLSPSKDFVRRMKEFDKALPLYVATVPRRRTSPYFNGFKTAGFKLVFGDVLEARREITDIIKAVPPRMGETVLGLLEQLVCARAEKFLGTGFSTFSEHIRRMRRWRELVVDESVKPGDGAGDASREAKLLAAKTPCDEPTRAC